jgi:hypothetical protein
VNKGLQPLVQNRNYLPDDEKRRGIKGDFSVALIE